MNETHHQVVNVRNVEVKQHLLHVLLQRHRTASLVEGLQDKHHAVLAVFNDNTAFTADHLDRPHVGRSPDYRFRFFRGEHVNHGLTLNFISSRYRSG